MTTPARRHYIRKRTAAAGTAAAGDALRQDLTQYELHLAQLAEHKRRLKQIRSVQRKVEFKRQALPEYDPYVEGVLEADTGATDDVVTTLMVWRIDVGEFRGALEIGEYVLRHDMPLPDQYQRDAATVLAEEIAEQALQDKTPAALCPVLANVADLVAGRDMPDQVSAKLYKALGYALRADEALPEALEALQTALDFDSKAGVKKDIERLQRQIKKQQPDEAPADPSTPRAPGGAAG